MEANLYLRYFKLIVFYLAYFLTIVTLYYLSHIWGLFTIGLLVVCPIFVKHLSNYTLPLAMSSLLIFIGLTAVSFYQILPLEFDILRLILFPLVHGIGVLIAKVIKI